MRRCPLAEAGAGLGSCAAAGPNSPSHERPQRQAEPPANCTTTNALPTTQPRLPTSATVQLQLGSRLITDSTERPGLLSLVPPPA